jgi:hypothetical protein
MFITILRCLVAVIIVVGVFRLPPRRKPIGVVAGLFLLLLPYLPDDAFAAWQKEQPSPELSVIIFVTVLVAVVKLGRRSGADS